MARNEKSRTTGTGPDPVPRLLYGITEAAQALSLSPRFVLNFVQQGAIKSVRVGRRLLIRHEELVRFARRNHESPNIPATECSATD